MSIVSIKLLLLFLSSACLVSLLLLLPKSPVSFYSRSVPPDLGMAESSLHRGDQLQMSRSSVDSLNASASSREAESVLASLSIVLKLLSITTQLAGTLFTQMFSYCFELLPCVSRQSTANHFLV